MCAVCQSLFCYKFSLWEGKRAMCAMLRDSHFVKKSIQAVQTWSNSNSMHVDVRHKTEQRFIAFLISYASCTCARYVNRYFVTNFHCGRENVPNQYKCHVRKVWQQLTRWFLCVPLCGHLVTGHCKKKISVLKLYLKVLNDYTPGIQFQLCHLKAWNFTVWWLGHRPL